MNLTDPPVPQLPHVNLTPPSLREVFHCFAILPPSRSFSINKLQTTTTSFSYPPDVFPNTVTMLDGEDELLHGRPLPEPTLTFTLPSLHDGTTLDCRVYHPFSLSISPRAPPWQRHAAIVAHPYAPLGGSWDDHTVGVVASTLLRLGYLVCTFNFRYLNRAPQRLTRTMGKES